MLRIALDIDDTLLDFWGAYIKKFGDPKNSLQVTRNVQALRLNKDFWENLSLIERPDFEPHIYCTKRINSKVYTRNSLRKHGLPIKPIYQLLTQNANKAQRIKGVCDVLVDDSPFNVREALRVGFPAILIDRGYNHCDDLVSIKHLTYEEISEAYDIIVEQLC